ncbi:non-ribosomal peptide synthetase [Streptomyces cyanogenus]|uniref:Linear gramicidin synthase subunit D n=1 Tax=Streptomyces cyanogenus TaxID=80860 RepID=A0ABX7TW12_STRCY|nr:non-ribosomal peptide synthetase [Streptomyces cyanogenus]QTD99693.1 Linear gramicidin synthase subunit D [Streptomyces cyanogenus]
MTTTTEILRQLADLGVRLESRDGRLSVTGPHAALTDELKQTLRDHRDAILRFLQEQRREDAERTVRVTRADRSGRIPASRAQQQMWLSEQLADGLPVYNMYFGVELQGDLDVAALRWAVGELVARHEILRTALTQTDGALVQTIEPEVPVPFHEHVAAPDDADALVRSLVSRRFDLSRAPLSRFDLISTGPRRWILLVTQHHAVSDGWSTGILKQELAELYRARVAGHRPDLAQLPLQYADFACWEEQWLASAAAERHRAFWRGALADPPPVLDLTPGRGRGTTDGHRGSALEFRYDQDLSDRVRALCAETGATAFTVLISAYSLLLARLSRSDDVVVGSPLASRPHADLERALGLFFNLVPVRTRIDEQLTSREFLASARRAVHDAFAHRELPFEQVVQAAAVRREGSHTPVFQTVFLFQTFPDTDFDLPGVRSTPVDVPTYSTEYDVMFRLSPHDDGLRGLLTYSDRQFTEDEARRFVAAYRSLLDGMCRTPDRPLAELGLLDAESAGWIERWNAATARPVPDRLVHEQILARLAEEPQRPALTFRGTTLTRGDLARHAASVAAGLRAAGLAPGARVGILMPRTPELVAVLLGVMSAGLAYVPLDGAAPASRLQTMVETAGCAALVVDDAYREACPGFGGPRLTAAELLHAPAGDPGQRATAGSAYVIFTSGSTGVPKGVEVTHANLANLFAALDDVIRPDHDTVWLSVTAVTFDIAVVELLWTLARGIPVVLAENMETLRRSVAGPDQAEPEAVPDLILASGVTALQATPTLLRTVLRLPHAAEALGTLRILMVGGEPLDLTLARELKALGIPRVVNMYGPTETTVWSTAWELPDTPERILVGRPLHNTALYVTDTQLNALPVGMYGELVIGGAGVARGYVGKPELTSERFPLRPALHPDGPVYRTGDLARLLPDGTVELSGRLDNQIKLRGHRIELEDVEQAVNAVPGVAQCAVALQGEGAQQVLVAHYVPRPGATLDEAALRAAVAERLPAAMVPSAFAMIASLPTTTSGKVDRRALPAVPLHRPDPAAAQPVHALEQRLLEIWRRVLGVQDLRVTDDFFQAGGSSLLVVRLLAEVREHVHSQASVVDFFSFPSVRAYAAHLTDREEPSSVGVPASRVPADSAGGRRQRMRQAAQRRRERAG